MKNGELQCSVDWSGLDGGYTCILFYRIKNDSMYVEKRIILTKEESDLLNRELE